MQDAREPVEPRRRTRRAALAAIVGLAFVVVAWMAAPLLVGLALGTVMAFTAQPLQIRLAARLRERRAVASALTTILGGLVMAVGGAAMFWIAAREIVAAVELVQRELTSGPQGVFGPRLAR